MEYFDAVGEACPVLVLFLWCAVFLAPRCALVVAVFSFGLLFSWRLRRSGVACFTVRLLVFPFFSPLPAFGDESGRTTCNQ